MIYKVTHLDGGVGYVVLDAPPKQIVVYQIRGDTLVQDFNEVSPIDLVETFKALRTSFGYFGNGWDVVKYIGRNRDRKIETIRLVRELQPGWSLVLCKDFCEWVWAKHAEIEPYLKAFYDYQEEVECYIEYLGWYPVGIESAIWRSDVKNLRLKKQPYPYAETIKAWANGAEVQYRVQRAATGDWDEWKDIEYPMFYKHKDIEYRVKPK